MFGRIRLAATLSLLVVVTPGRARAEPQWNTGLLLGAAGTGARGELWGETHFYGGVHGDLLLGRHGDGDVGVGPALEVGSAGFTEVRALVGPSLLVPLGDVLAVGVTPGGVLHHEAGVTSLGVGGRLFLGARSFNHYGSYNISGGLSLGLDRDLDSRARTAVVVAAHLDGMLLALPVILLIQWVRGPAR